MGVRSVTKLLREQWPELALDGIEALDEGDFCEAYIVNDEWVVRVAKHREAARSLAREACLLPRIASLVDVTVPMPEVIRPDGRRAFNAHRLVPGPQLTREAFELLPAAVRARCAAQVGQFLDQLHRADIGTAEACGVPRLHLAKRCKEVLQAARKHAFAHLTSDDHAFVLMQLEGPQPETTDPVLLHGDLSPEHVLYDDQRGSVTGVIDFGDLRIGDRAWDFVYLYEDYGIELLELALRRYAPIEHPSELLSRMYRWYLVAMIEWVAESAAEEDDELPDAIGSLHRARREHDLRVRQLAEIARRAR